MEDTFSDRDETEKAKAVSEIFTQIDDVKCIEVKNFSSIISCEYEHVYFIRKKNFTGPLYAVYVYPDGFSSENQGYVSVQVSKVLKDADTDPEVGYDSITWTFSVVDVDGNGRYFQSMTKDNIPDVPYQIVIPEFLKRSFVLERSDELLPGDVFTIRCEATFVYYSVDALHDNFVIDLFNEDDGLSENTDENCCVSKNEATFFGYLENELRLHKFSENQSDEKFNKFMEYYRNCEPFEDKLATFGRNISNLEDITYYVLILLGFLRQYQESEKKQNLQSKDLIFQKSLIIKIIMNTEDSDELAKTYMSTDPYFKLYIRLKSRVKDILNENPIVISEEEQLDNDKYNHLPIYTRGNYATVSESYSMMEKIAFGIMYLRNPLIESRHDHPLSLNEYKYLLKIFSEVSKVNQAHQYLYEAMKFDRSDLLDSSEEQDRVDSDCSRDNEWILQIQTQDGTIFDIPFEEGKDTLGSKLITCSSVFESMLRNPMLERFSKKVVLSDIDFETFRNFLQFLQGGCVVTKHFVELYNLYEMADKYDVKALMFDCSLKFRPFLNKKYIPIVEGLASLHSDDFLLDIIKSFKTEHSDMNCGYFMIKRHLKSSLNENRHKFDFYQ